MDGRMVRGSVGGWVRGGGGGGMKRSVSLEVRGWEVRLLLERREGGESLFWL